VSLHTIILAAGEGRRFGAGIKQLALLGDKTLLERSMDLAQSVSPNKVIVVLGCHQQTISSRINIERFVVNENWEAGMATSIAAGVQALPTSATAALILLCDQVALTREDLSQLTEEFAKDQTKIVCAFYEKQLGVPAIFPCSYFDELINLTGDFGAKKLLQSNSIISVEIPSAAIDVDTPDMLESYCCNIHRNDKS
jgi:molybdenum cofactor cytidylyltransferase